MKFTKPLKLIWKNTASRVWFIVTAVLLVIMIALPIVSNSFLLIKNTLNLVLGAPERYLVSGDPSKYTYYESDYDSKEATLTAANKLNESIAEEGFVLVKNDGALPFTQSNPKVSVFGKNSVNLVYGGTGSGGASSSGAPTLYSSLTDAGISFNPTLKSFYDNNSSSGSGRPPSPAMGDILWGLSTGETNITSLTSNTSVTNSYAEYNDAAIIVISRMGGEGFDLPRTMMTRAPGGSREPDLVNGAKNKDDHYLQLDANEQELVKHVTDNFSRVIVVINCSQAIELGFVADNDKINAALWIGSPGFSGINAFGRILKGTVNPSGRLVDTYARDFKKDPTWNNFGNNLTSGGNRYKYSENKNYQACFVEYEEGIYVGYRYYETRGYTEDDTDTWYKNNVAYPFGHGLSYTSFEWTLGTTSPASGVLSKDGTITVAVKVKNTGTVAGKDVVQLYYTAPYSQNEVEKSHVVLGDFAKTKKLAAGETDTVTLTIKVRDMASYDYNDANDNGHIGYDLDGGAYTIWLARSAHDHDPEETLKIDYTVPTGGYQYETSDATNNPIENRFDDVSGHIKKYLSRSDWTGTFPAKPDVNTELSIDKAFVDALSFSSDDTGKPWYSSTKPSQKSRAVKRADVQLYELIGADYDDPRWESVLNSLTVREMAELIGTGSFTTKNLDGIGKPRTIDPDGPVGFTNFMGDPSVYGTCFYASECVTASTFNKELAYEMGKMVGNEGIWGYQKGDGTPYSGWYAPAVNIHRSPFSGRNWEYYSEDGLLSGKMAANVVQGAKSKGVYTYVKHFALNDQETDRDNNGLITWANEQTMREIYFKPFELAVKEGGTTAMMSSFNRIGTTWAGGSYALLTNVLREEWGFKGMVITDYNVYDHMPVNQMIRAGGDLNLMQDKMPTVSNDATQVTQLRRATKNILYTVVNSNAMNGYGEGVFYSYRMATWLMLMLIIEAAITLGLAAWGFFVIRRTYKKSAVPSGNVEVITPVISKE